MVKHTAAPAKAARAARTRKPTNAAPSRLAAKIAMPRRRTPRCLAVTKSGEPCKANPMQGKRCCLFHTPGRASELGTKGGRRRTLLNPANLEPLPAPKNAADWLTLLSNTVLELRSGKMDAKTANSIAILSSAYLSALEKADFETRMRALEEKLPKNHSQRLN